MYTQHIIHIYTGASRPEQHFEDVQTFTDGYHFQSLALISEARSTRELTPERPTGSVFLGVQPHFGITP